jgi:hypothetical protein
MHFETLTIYDVCLRHRRSSYLSQINHSRVESDASVFSFDQRLTRSYSRIVSFVFRVFLRSRIVSKRKERRLLERCSILKNLLCLVVLFIVWYKFLISTSLRFVSQFFNYYLASISDQHLMFFESQSNSNQRL